MLFNVTPTWLNEEASFLRAPEADFSSESFRAKSSFYSCALGGLPYNHLKPDDTDRGKCWNLNGEFF